MKSAFLFLPIAVVMLTTVNVPSQTSKESSAEPMVFIHGPSGSVLLRQCQAAERIAEGEKYNTPQAIDGTFCRGYVAGTVDQMVALSLQTTTVYCLPSNADNDQILRVVLKYLKENPATLNYPAGALVSRAIVAAFPCK
jgi:hypothetical protein